MRILIITMHVGKTAPGIVFEKLIKGLAASHEIDLLVADYVPSVDLSLLTRVIVSKKRIIHPRISKFFISFLGVDPFDWCWALKSEKILLNNTRNKYDLILCFLSSGNYAAIVSGNRLSGRLNCKLAIHSTDAIPAPIGWIKDDLFYKGLKRMMKRYLSKVDAFFTTNREMLQYQLNIFEPKRKITTNVIYNSGLEEYKAFPQPEGATNNFVYTGGIYSVRKSEYILTGFEKLLNRHPDSKLVFVGSDPSEIPLGKYLPDTRRKIEFVPFTRDLDPYYKCATALIDIDADIENDVFISSKMPVYLMINRIIISETGNDSPARHLFKGIESIIQCDHDPDQLCEAMERSILSMNQISFKDRDMIIKLFQLQNIVDQLNHSLGQLVSTR